MRRMELTAQNHLKPRPNRIKRSGREANHSLPPDAEVNNEWRYTSPSLWLYGAHRDKFSLFYNFTTTQSPPQYVKSKRDKQCRDFQVCGISYLNACFWVKSNKPTAHTTPEWLFTLPKPDSSRCRHIYLHVPYTPLRHNSLAKCNYHCFVLKSGQHTRFKYTENFSPKLASYSSMGAGDITADIMTRPQKGRPRYRGSIAGGKKIFSPQRPDRVWAHPSACSVGNGDSSLG